MLGTDTMTENNIMARLESLFEQINQCIEDSLDSQVPYITQVCRHILLSRGKRLRPALFVLGARLCGAAGPGQIYISQATCDLVKSRSEVSTLEPLTLKGISQPAPVYELIALKES